MKNSIKIFACALVLLALSANASAVLTGEARLAGFEKSGIYANSGLFDSASVSAGGTLILSASQKFMALGRDDKDAASGDAAGIWKQLSPADKIAFVEIKEDDKRTALWEIKENDPAVMAEQWGPEIRAGSANSVFISWGINGTVAAKALNAYATIGTYFFQNMLDSAFNISYAKGGSPIVGLSGRLHFLLDPKWDFNMGAQGSYTGNVLSISGLIGFSNFVGYRSSLDLTLSVGTAGATIGAGLTHYFDDRADVNINRGPREITKEKETTPALAAATQGYTPRMNYYSRQTSTATPIPTLTQTPTAKIDPTPSVTDTPVPQPVKSAVNTPGPSATAERAGKETEEELKIRLKKEILEEMKKDSGKETKTEPDKSEPAEQKEGTTAGIFIEADLMSIERSITNNWTDWNARLGFGDDGNFGMAFIIDGMKYQDDNMTGLTVGLDLGFDIYPFGRSPSGFYLGPVIGGAINHLKINQQDGEDFYNFTAGGEAGIRMLMNWFVLDLAFAYNANFNFYGEQSNDEDQVFEKNSLQSDYFFRAGIGVQFYASDIPKKK